MSLKIFTRWIDRLVDRMCRLADLLPRQLAWLSEQRPAAKVLQTCTTVTTPVRLQRVTARLRRRCLGIKCSWP